MSGEAGFQEAVEDRWALKGLEAGSSSTSGQMLCKEVCFPEPNPAAGLHCRGRR